MIATTATEVRTTLISAVGLEGGDALHLNGRIIGVVDTDIETSATYMRVYFFNEADMDFIVLKQAEMVSVSV